MAKLIASRELTFQVAAAKGLIAGPIDLFMWGGGVTRCGLSSGNVRPSSIFIWFIF